MNMTFTKRPREPLSARAEAAGLIWLREAAGKLIVGVVSVDDEQLTTARVTGVAPSPRAARAAGRGLARMHLAGAPAFGSPPAGWEGPNYIGTQRQECRPEDNWARFYIEQRVLPFARAAAAAGNLDDLAVVEDACAAILVADLPEVAPARLHGDLWSGNLLFGKKGPVLIDPAAHGGHPETDLAMLALFGAPYLEEIFVGYEEVSPRPDGWRELIPMHQLHPLAVHAVTHGLPYGHALADAAAATLAALDALKALG